MVYTIDLSFFIFPSTYNKIIQKCTLKVLNTLTLGELMSHLRQQKPELHNSNWKPFIYKNLRLIDKEPIWNAVTMEQLSMNNSILIINETSSEQINRLLFEKRMVNESDPTENRYYFQISVYVQKTYDGLQRILEVPKDITIFEVKLLLYLIHREQFHKLHIFSDEIENKDWPTTLEQLHKEFGVVEGRTNKLFKNSPFEFKILRNGTEVYLNQNFFDSTNSKFIEIEMMIDFDVLSNDLSFRKYDVIDLTNLEFEKPSITLQSCFEKFSQKEILDEENKWYCSKCKEHKNASKQMTISRMPQHLVIHFKRFLRNSKNLEVYHKFEGLITFEIEELDLTPFFGLDGQKCVYELYSVCNHYGTVNNGHYTAYCKNQQASNWIVYDDRVCKEIPREEVVTKNAYLLFYRRKLLV